jgi:hypothetical protein
MLRRKQGRRTAALAKFYTRKNAPVSVKTPGRCVFAKTSADRSPFVLDSGQAPTDSRAAFSVALGRITASHFLASTR